MPLDAPRVAEARQWFIKAARDLQAAEVLLAATPPLLGEVAFHCQQAAEKAMKGHLTWYDITFPKTHDLARIGGLCVDRAAGSLRDHDMDACGVPETAPNADALEWMKPRGEDPFAIPRRADTRRA